MKNKRFMKIISTVSIGVLLLSSSGFSNEAEHENHDSHEMHEWELGISTGYANLKTEGKEGKNLHLHLLKRLGDDGLGRYFSVGFGAEVIVTDEKHYGAMFTLAYHPAEDFVLSVSPGFEWSKHEGDSWKRIYATHLEASYSFDISENYHIGPVIGYSKTDDAEHYTVGIHIGIPL
jgi:opacity protein-like surface antigen